MLLLISSMKATLLALLIVTYVGPSASPPQDDEDYEAPDSVIQWSPERSHITDFQDLENSRDSDYMIQPLDDNDYRQSDEYYNLLKDIHVDHKMSPKQMLRDTYTKTHREDTGQDFINALNYLSLLEKANHNRERELDFKRMISFPWSKSRKGKTHDAAVNLKNQYCRITQPPTRRPNCYGSTTDSRPPSTCSYTAKTTAAPRITTPPPTAKPCHNRQKSRKGHQKPRFRKMNQKKAKVLLKVIMDTKQHVLLTLEILNHMENELLTRSPDICQRQSSDLKPVPAKWCPVPKKKSEKPRKISSYREHPRKGAAIMALARQKHVKHVKHKDHIAPYNSEDNWYPISSGQAANRRGYKKKYRHYGQKQQSRLKNIPPGMVAILT